MVDPTTTYIDADAGPLGTTCGLAPGVSCGARPRSATACGSTPARCSATSRSRPRPHQAVLGTCPTRCSARRRRDRPFSCNYRPARGSTRTPGSASCVETKKAHSWRAPRPNHLAYLGRRLDRRQGQQSAPARSRATTTASASTRRRSRRARSSARTRSSWRRSRIGRDAYVGSAPPSPRTSRAGALALTRAAGQRRGLADRFRESNRDPEKPARSTERAVRWLAHPAAVGEDQRVVDIRRRGHRRVGNDERRPRPSGAGTAANATEAASERPR